MSQRNSGYDRIPHDLYITPTWCYDALYGVETFYAPWDCAPVNATFDFLKVESAPSPSIVSNPPFGQLTEFCRHAIELTREHRGKVAMLAPLGFITAKGRRDLWLPPFKALWILTRRIRWANLPQKKAGPSQNHSWLIWDHCHSGPPTIGWLP